MSEKTKTPDAEAAKPKEKDAPKTSESIVERFKALTKDERAEIAALMKLEDKPHTEHGHETKNSAETSIFTPLAPETKDGGHEHTATDAAHATPHAPSGHGDHGPAAHNEPPAYITAKMSPGKKAMTVAAAATLGTLATLAASGTALPAYLQTSVWANAVHGWLASAAAPAVSTLGFWGALAAAPASILLGLGALGKGVNIYQRWKNPNVPPTGILDLKNIWLGTKAVAYPFVKVASWIKGGFNWTTNAIASSTSPVLRRTGHELQNGIKWGVIGGVAFGAFSALTTGGVVPAGIVAGGLAGAVGRMGWRAWNRFILNKPSTLPAAGEHAPGSHPDHATPSSHADAGHGAAHGAEAQHSMAA